MKKIIFGMGVSMLIAMNSSASVSSALDDTQLTVQGAVEDNEGNIYRTVKIGDRVWLAENLRSTKFQNGAPVSTGFIPDDDENNLPKYGRLYDWNDVTDERNICPSGWRVASDDDWKTLESAIGIAESELDKEGWRGENDIAITLKAEQPNTLFKRFDQSKVNQYKFFATPAGVKLGNWYLTQGAYTEFWTSTNATDKEAFARTLAYSWWNSHKGEIRRAKLKKSYMFSVRCVQI
ncbi:fibrobacter succinogenes major paralogous domain-containing protein [Alteromonas sp. 1_MG-2023]|uniref:fibrobacter succinogenes major paralogous domain-containing protein n=1 Tax=Alteromonas sp. 1_MG-2023 TaxID=3062669 RepID=UPI0026E3059C|nr:fibrobacter succinogenes major paralogous domain-containing protein [Alteromonas sp. 1_MG-2023]MDO6569223.1 fibrobacter succinogenes major paralogous domain-containing protein [Alteromonas sp. 1_MG-2023]